MMYDDIAGHPCEGCWVGLGGSGASGRGWQQAATKIALLCVVMHAQNCSWWPQQGQTRRASRCPRVMPPVCLRSVQTAGLYDRKSATHAPAANPHPGQLFNRPKGPDVYAGVKIVSGAGAHAPAAFGSRR